MQLSSGTETKLSDAIEQLEPSHGTSTLIEAGSPISNIVTAYGQLDESKAETEFCFPDGRVIRISTADLLKADARLSLNRAAAVGTEPPVVIPVLEERLEVTTKIVETGKVVLEKHIDEYQQALDETLAVRTFEIEHVPLNQVVADAPSVRQEGDTTIYPIVEERLVLTKELVLREEVRVTRRDTEKRDTRVITLQRESVTVNRVTVDG